MYVVEAQDLTKIYQTRLKKGNITALNGVTLGIEQGDIFGLLGPNGAGKTTFVKILLGITQVSSGSVLINGLPPSNPESRNKTGFLPENHRFPAYLTGKELLQLAGRLYGMPSGQIEERVPALLKLVSMGKWADTKIARYSKGMLQRVGLAQALIADPDLLLLDEPTDGVDPVGKSEIKEILRRIKNEGKTVLLNSHLLSEVEEVADRVAMLSKGKLARTGTVADFTTKKLRYEIQAEIGNERLEIPADVGKLVRITTKALWVDLSDIKKLDWIIDRLRMKGISIRAIQPSRISLEQSFIETLTDSEEKAT